MAGPSAYGPSARHLRPASCCIPWRHSRRVSPTELTALCQPPPDPPGPSLVPPLLCRPLSRTTYSAASATRSSVLLARLPPAFRSTPWCCSCLVPPTHHSASCHPPLVPLALRQSHLCRPLLSPTIALRPPRAPASVLLAACLPPAARSAHWCRSRSRLVSPTHHSASCHPPLTPSPVPPLSPTIAHYSAAFYASATLTAECWLLPLLHA